MARRSGSDLQREHYDSILDDYDAEYGDPTALEYRQRFFLSPLWSELDLNGKDVADLAAGSGHTTTALKARFPQARVIGFDVSERAVRKYSSNTGCEAHVWDLTGEEQPIADFDVAIVVGGLHHCIMSIDAVLSNVARLLRPGGVFLMVEPSRDSVLEPFRRFWYRQDKYFESSTEGALCHDELLERGKQWFNAVSVRYMGGLAYFVVYNSLVLRVPSGLKRRVAPPLMLLEELTNRLPLRRLFPYFIAQWRRRPEP